MALPDPSDVRLGIDYDDGQGGATMTGELNLPQQCDVRCGVEYDSGSKTGRLQPAAKRKVRNASCAPQYERDKKDKCQSTCGHIMLDDPCATTVTLCENEE